MEFIITDIEFDTDGNTKLAEKLKKEWIGKTFEAKNRDDANQHGVDIISDQCGWCILNYNFKRKNNPMPKKKKLDPDVCPKCSSRNTNLLEKNTHECYDCGTTYKLTATKVVPPKSTKTPAKKTWKYGLVKVGGYSISEKELMARIIDKITAAQFHKIVKAIEADLKKENA